MAKKKGGGGDTRLVVMSNVKDLISCADMRTSGELDVALNKVVHDLIQRAIERCRENGKATIRPCDL